MKPKLKQQVDLEFENGNRLTAWIDVEFKPKEGMFFTGKDKRTGKIVHVHPVIISLEEINREWKVGGL